jgi:hypothetical protein
MNAAWLLATLLAAQLCMAGASAHEICRYAGTTDYDGQVAVTTDVTEADGTTRVDVAVTFEATSMLFFRLRYLVEEISLWRGGELRELAANTRSFLGGRVTRQVWDDFRRQPGGLLAWRVQAKSSEDFRRLHPGFAAHWDPQSFGQPWQQDFAAAPPERRPDLDLRAASLPVGLRSPLALAFYWVRWLPRRGADVPVFLPGFKHDLLVDLPVTTTHQEDGTLLRAELHHSALSSSPPSTATAWISGKGLLQRLAFDLHAQAGSGSGLIMARGCEGTPPQP